MCDVLNVTRNGFYNFVHHNLNKPVDPLHEEMLEWVEDIAKASEHTYGYRRMKEAMNALGYPISRHKAKKLMNEAGVRVKRQKKHKVTTNSNHKQPVFDNLLERNFDVESPDQAYVADITYSVPGVQGKHGCLNGPRVYLKYANKTLRTEVFTSMPGCAGM